MVYLKQYFLWPFKLVLLGLSILVLTPDTIFRYPAVGLDPSWNIGINLAVANNFTFGKAFIFTYGPLGYLHTRLPIGISKIEYLAWDAFFLAVFVFILFYLYWHLNSISALLLAFGAVMVFSQAAISIETLFLPFLFLLFHHLKHGSLITLVLAAALSLIMFYAKVNVGLAAVTLLLVYLLYHYLFPLKHSRQHTLLAIAIFLGALVLSAWGLNTYLPGYIRGGLHLANDYNDAMFSPVTSNPYALPAIYLALGSIIPLGLVMAANLKHFLNNRDALLRASFVAAYIFILFKHSFVRADWHMLNFFQSITLAVGLLAFFSERPLSLQYAGVTGLALALSMPFATSYYDLKQFTATAATLPAQEFVAGTITHISQDYEDFTNYLSLAVDSGYNPAPSPLPDARLPDRFLQRIGQKSVDVVPWEISYIYANHLTYNPRPVIQSYQAYNDYLDSRNREKYLSDSAPDYILFHVDTIDNRHPSFTESKTRLAMATRYQFVDQQDGLLLLEKRAAPLDTTEFPPITGTSQLGQDITLEQTDDILMMSFDIHYSIAGKLARTFFQPPPLYVTLKFKDGDEKTFKAIKSVINGEVLANRLINHTNTAIEFFKDPQRTHQTITAIQFHSPKPWGFEPKFIYSSKRIQLPTNIDQTQ